MWITNLSCLNDLGFGLDLNQCAVTGKTNDLVYISPKSGRAVCADAGQPYADRLFKIPEFWVHPVEITLEQFHQALTITSYFFSKRLIGKRIAYLSN